MPSLRLRNGFEKHALSFRICFEGLLIFGQQNGYRCALWKPRVIKFNSTIDDPTGSDSHSRILTLPRRLTLCKAARIRK